MEEFLLATSLEVCMLNRRKQQDQSRSMLGRVFGGEDPGGAPMDEAIVERIYADIARRTDIDREAIHVTCWDGEVTLRGTVPNEEGRVELETAAKGVEGVMIVRNEVRVKGDQVA
jgi:osmotically-inducible protein OsmY